MGHLVISFGVVASAQSRKDWSLALKSGAPNNDFPLSLLKTLFRLSRVVLEL